MKPSLSPQEQLISAYAHYIVGLEQQAIAVVMNTNIGRVNEACKKIGAAAGIIPEVVVHDGVRLNREEANKL